MILLTRLNGERFALNVDLIERVEMTPDTVVTMTHGTKHVVAESVGEVIDEVRSFKASILALSQLLPISDPPDHDGGSHDTTGRESLRLVQPEAALTPGAPGLGISGTRP